MTLWGVPCFHLSMLDQHQLEKGHTIDYFNCQVIRCEGDIDKLVGLGDQENLQRLTEIGL